MPTSKRISSEKNRATQYIACISLGMKHCSGQKGFQATLRTVAYAWMFYYYARTYLQLPLWQWGAGNVYLLVLSSWKVNIAENPFAVMGL